MTSGMTHLRVSRTWSQTPKWAYSAPISTLCAPHHMWYQGYLEWALGMHGVCTCRS